MILSKNESRKRRKVHIRKKISGTVERPRLVVYRSNLHIYAQREGYRHTEWERDGRQYGWGNNRALVLMKLIGNAIVIQQGKHLAPRGKQVRHHRSPRKQP